MSYELNPLINLLPGISLKNEEDCAKIERSPPFSTIHSTPSLTFAEDQGYVTVQYS